MTLPTNCKTAKIQWIGGDQTGGPRSMAVAPHLRREFNCRPGLLTATLHATALGLYECELNGSRVGDHVFAPGWTDYRKRIYYQTHDVTALLRQGKNVWGVILGDGWYCGHVAWRHRQTYGDRPRFLGQLDLVYDDGAHETIGTGKEWKTTGGPILENDMIMGETYDARRELGSWSRTGYDDSAWLPATLFDRTNIEIQRQPGPPVRAQEILLPRLHQTIDEMPKRLIYDFGQNFSGRVRFTARAAAGTHLILRHGEVLDGQGRLHTENLRSARATDQYTFRSGESETWEPRFTFHGFRYVEFQWRGALADIVFEKIEGVVIHSDMAPTGAFSCSHPLINRLQSNIVWGQKSNFLEVPTDCPQRDERMGWTGDAQVFVRTACFNRDVRLFFHKWMQDARDAQHDDGAVPCVVPDPDDNKTDGGPAWSDAHIICPWTVYLCYGDRRILEDHYASMQRYLDHLLSISKALIRSHPDDKGWEGFGDWLAPDGSKGFVGNTRKDLIGTAYLAYDAELMAKIANVLGHTEDAGRYQTLHHNVVAAFRRRFLTADGLIAGATQTSWVLALKFGLISEPHRPGAIRELVRLIEANGNLLATGFVGTSYLCEVLSDHGRLDVAYRLLEQEECPSWLFPVKQGATTIWERWDGWSPEKGLQDPFLNSLNHYAYGAIGAWLYRTVGGLDTDESCPGYERSILRPQPGGSLTHATATLETKFGTLACTWKIEDGNFRMEATVPAGTTARIHLPTPDLASVTESGEPLKERAAFSGFEHSTTGSCFTAPSGFYRFSCPYHPLRAKS